MFARRPYIVAGSLIILKKKKTTNSDLVLFVSHLVAIKIVSCLSISFKILDRSKSTVLSNINQYHYVPYRFTILLFKTYLTSSPTRLLTMFA